MGGQAGWAARRDGQLEEMGDTTGMGTTMTMTPEQATRFADVFERLTANIERSLHGKSHVVRLALTALFALSAVYLRTYLED
jgi:hypothetical protein